MMEIYILNKDFNILDVFSIYESIVWNPKLHEPGRFKAKFIFTERMNKVLKEGNLLYKTDEIEPVIIKKKSLSLSNKGEEFINIEGYMASRYLNQRIVWSKMILKGTPETIMRKMVEEQAANPSDPTRKMPGIELGEFKNINQNEIQKQVTYDNLQKSLTEIAQAAELGYRLRLDMSEKKLFFDVYQGMDRTFGTEHPCIFSRDFNNVFTQKYEEDSTNFRNICLVGGPGEDDARITQSVGTASGLDRYEMFYSAGMSDKDLSTSEILSQLTQKGYEKLSSYKKAKSFDSKINQKKAMEFSLGDYVTCVDPRWGITLNTQIKEIMKGFSKSEESFVVTFGDSAPTFIDLLKAKE